MPVEYKILYKGDEKTKQVQGVKPHRKELNAIAEHIVKKVGAETISEAVIGIFDFMSDPANDNIKDKYRKYKQSTGTNKTVLVYDDDKNVKRRFPFILDGDKKVWQQKRVGYANVIFNYTGKDTPDGYPEYIAKCSSDQWNKIRNATTQIGKLPMYVEIEATEDNGTIKELIKDAVAQRMEKSVVAVKEEVPEPVAEPEPKKKSKTRKE